MFQTRVLALRSEQFNVRIHSMTHRGHTYMVAGFSAQSLFGDILAMSTVSRQFNRTTDDLHEIDVELCLNGSKLRFRLLLSKSTTVSHIVYMPVAELEQAEREYLFGDIAECDDESALLAVSLELPPGRHSAAATFQARAIIFVGEATDLCSGNFLSADEWNARYGSDHNGWPPRFTGVQVTDPLPSVALPYQATRRRNT